MEFTGRMKAKNYQFQFKAIIFILVGDPENPVKGKATQFVEGKWSHCFWILVLSVFPLIYCGLYFAIKYTITTDGDLLNLVRVNSSGPAAELYPESLGEYKLIPDVTHNNRPVYQHLTRDDRYIISVGNTFLYLISFVNNFL